MATKSISQLNTAATVDNDDLFEVAHPDSGSGTGYTSNKQSLAAIADHIARVVNYPTLATTAQTLIAAINEAANSGGNSHGYSATEQVIGTWVDGKPVYEKTVDFGYLPNTNTTTVNHGITNLKRVVSFDAGGMNSSGVFLPIPKVSPLGLQYCVDIAVTDTQILITTGNDRSGYYAYVTLRYTKNTD